jgi:sugar-specific transcriptional regulator TrmB
MIQNNMQFKYFLNELGLSDIQTEIYYSLIRQNNCTINQIKENLNLSYSQTINNLTILQKKGLVGTGNFKPKSFHLIDPKTTLQELVEKKNEFYNENIEKIDEEISISESKQGICIKDISHYYYSDISLGIEKFYRLIRNAKEKIILSSLPFNLMKKLESVLKDSFIKGVKIEIYYSVLDYDSQINCLEEITNIFKQIRVSIIEIEEKACQRVGYNNNIINNGYILIDEGFFNTVGFMENDIFYTQGFYSKIIISQIIDMFHLKTIVKQVELKYPKIYEKIIRIIEENKESLKTRDLSKITGIGGTKLKKILNFLKNEGIIEEKINISSKGRPGIYYSKIKI